MKYRILRYLAALILILGMTIIAEQSGEKEIIFPEILALAVGAWVAEKRPWKTTLLTLWMAPTLAALFGILVMRYSQMPTTSMVALAFVFVALLLTAKRSTLMPSISAAILPILIGTTSWIYPLSVCVLTGVISLAVSSVDRFLRHTPQSFPQKTVTSPVSFADEFLFWGRLLLIVMGMTFLALSFKIPFLVAPPLIVTLVEFSLPNSSLRKHPAKVFLLLGLAAWMGMLSHSFLFLHLGWPLWITAAITTTALFLCYELLGMLFPPAAAIALLPTLLPSGQLPHYPWQVMAGTVFFLLTSYLFFRSQRSGGANIPPAS